MLLNEHLILIIENYKQMIVRTKIESPVMFALIYFLFKRSQQIKLCHAIAIVCTFFYRKCGQV